MPKPRYFVYFPKGEPATVWAKYVPELAKKGLYAIVYNMKAAEALVSGLPPTKDQIDRLCHPLKLNNK